MGSASSGSSLSAGILGGSASKPFPTRIRPREPAGPAPEREAAPRVAGREAGAQDAVPHVRPAAAVEQGGPVLTPHLPRGRPRAPAAAQTLAPVAQGRRAAVTDVHPH